MGIPEDLIHHTVQGSDLIIPKIHHQDLEEDLEEDLEKDLEEGSEEETQKDHQEAQEDHQEEVATSIQEDWIQT